MSKKLHDSGFRDWTPDQLQDLSGKTYVITGGNSGIGLEAAKMLAGAEADILIAARNPDKAKRAVEDIDGVGRGETGWVHLDLASMSSVRAGAKEVQAKLKKVDGLINNAGIMQTPPQTTQDGFEMQLGTNHLGHFLWTGLLFDLVEKANGRIVTVSSIAHKFGIINFDDLMGEKKYSPSIAYAQSKLANLMFALELDRRLKAKESPVSSLACHPGYSDTQLQSTGPGALLTGVYKILNRVAAQPAYNGAVPTVLCAAGAEAKPGGYYGPQNMQECRGRISDAIVTGRARKRDVAARLWQVSEGLTGFVWDKP